MVVKFDGVEVVIDDCMKFDSEYIKEVVSNTGLSLSNKVELFRKIFRKGH